MDPPWVRRAASGTEKSEPSIDWDPPCRRRATDDWFMGVNLGKKKQAARFIQEKEIG